MYLIVRYLHDSILCKAPWINDSSRRRLAATIISYRKKGKREREREKEKIPDLFCYARAELCENKTTPRYVYPRAKLTRYLLNDANITGRLFLINKKIIANICVNEPFVAFISFMLPTLACVIDSIAHRQSYCIWNHFLSNTVFIINRYHKALDILNNYH